MTTERDSRTRAVLSWLREDAHENAERVLLRALDEVDTTPQRRSWWPARGIFRMDKVAITAATAAVLVVAVVGYNLLPWLGFLGPAGEPSPTPTPSADGSLPVGAHLIDPVGAEHGEDRVTVAIAARGWFAPDSGSLTKDLGGGDRVTLVVVPGDHYTVPLSICDWQLDGEPYETRARFPPTADGFVAYVTEQTYDLPDGALTRDFSAPVDITVDGSHGQRIVDRAPAYPDSDASACDEQRFCTVQDRDKFECLLSHPEPGALDTLWIVDPPEGRNYFLVVASTGSPGTALREEMNALVSSMTFVE